jgi:hypothetical protein
MIYKTVVGIVAAALFLIYMAPVVLRLREWALTIVALTGAVMMLVDLWQSLRAKED